MVDLPLAVRPVLPWLLLTHPLGKCVCNIQHIARRSNKAANGGAFRAQQLRSVYIPLRTAEAAKCADSAVHGYTKSAHAVLVNVTVWVDCTYEHHVVGHWLPAVASIHGDHLQVRRNGRRVQFVEVDHDRCGHPSPRKPDARQFDDGVQEGVDVFLGHSKVEY